jgi:phosphoribosylanthranilate isomerase
MTDEQAVQAAVDAGAGAVGFVFYARSPRNLTPDQAAELAAKVPPHVKKVAVMLHPDANLWNQVSKVLRPDVLQTDSEDFAYLTVDQRIEKWPVLREGAVPKAGRFPGTFVYEGRRSGMGETVDWNAAATIAREGRMILAGGLNAVNVAEAITRVAPYGVDVSSAVESRPGVKDAARIAAFVKAAMAAAKIGKEN